MRSICSIIIRLAALILALSLCIPGFATEADGELTLGMLSVKTTFLNPLQAQERDFQALTHLIYDSLVVLDDNYMPQSAVAESWVKSNDAKKWTFYLREDVTFHDGTPLTAYDVEATVNEILRLGAEGKGQYSSLKYMVDSVTATDAKTLNVVSKRPYYGFIYAMTFPILPKDQVQSADPVGSGPYFVSAFAPGDYLYLTVNDNWWQEPSDIRYLNVVFTNETRSLVGLYENNEVDAAITRSASAAQFSRGTSSVSLSYRTQQLETLLINNKDYAGYLNDPNVRLAIRYALNIDQIAQSAYQDMVIRTDTPLPMGTWMYQDDPSFRYDPDKARELLAQAGWVDMDNDPNHILNKVIDGKVKNLHLRLYVYEEQSNSVRVEAANQIADMLLQVGIEVKVENISFTQASEKLSAGSYDLCLAAYQMDAVPDPGFMLMSGNTGNYARYRSSAMDELFDALRKASDFDEYERLLHQVQTQFAQDCPFICLYYRTGAVMTRKLFTFARDVREPHILRGIETYHRD